MLAQPRVTPLLGVAWLLLSAPATEAQQLRDSTLVRKPIWQDSARYGGGPSVGAPPSDFTGQTPPAKWCLQATRRATGDFGVSGGTWTATTRSWLRQVLGDTTAVGDGWRKVLGGAPSIAPMDSIVQVIDEQECSAIAQVINRDILGWPAGPPPVVVLRIRDFLVVYPSNVHLGEFGLAVGMGLRRNILGVATW